MTYRTQIDGNRLMALGFQAAAAASNGSSTGPASPSRQLLHFGAVDWQMEVYINSIWVGSHEGAYDSFFFDITDALLATSGGGAADEVLVQVAMAAFRGLDLHLPTAAWVTPMALAVQCTALCGGPS